MNTNTKLVILMTGAARSGKDTSSDYMVKMIPHLTGKHVTKTYFAKALKESLKRVFNLTDEHVYGDLKEVPMSITVRPLTMMQTIMEELHHGSLMSVHSHVKGNIATLAMRITVAMCDAITGNGAPLRSPNTYEVSPRQLMQWWGTEAVRESAYDAAWVDCVTFDIGMNTCDVAIVSDARFNNEVLALRKAFPEAKVVCVEVQRKDKPKVAAHASEAGISPELVDFVIKNDETTDVLFEKLDTLVSTLI